MAQAEIEAEARAYIGSLLMAVAVANGLGLLGLATVVASSDTPKWIVLVLIPSAWLFMFGMALGGIGCAFFAIYRLSKAWGVSSKYDHLRLVTVLGGIAFVLLVFGVLYPLGEITALAKDGVL